MRRNRLLGLLVALALSIAPASSQQYYPVGVKTANIEPVASDNHQVVANGSHILFSVSAQNNNTSGTPNYVRFYDAGTGFNGCNSATNLKFGPFHIPSSTSMDAGFMLPIPPGVQFNNGIAICVTGGYGTTDTTNATATAIDINLVYL